MAAPSKRPQFALRNTHQGIPFIAVSTEVDAEQRREVGRAWCLLDALSGHKPRRPENQSAVGSRPQRLARLFRVLDPQYQSALLIMA